MLGNEDRMTAYGRLLAIVERFWGRQPLLNEVAGMRKDHLDAFGIEICAILGSQPEARAEWRSG